MQEKTDEIDFVSDLGQRIRELREKSGLSSAEVARRLLMDRGNYTRIETGKTNPTIKTLFRLSKIIDCQMIDFFN